MKRHDFITNKKISKKKETFEPLNNATIDIYINGKKADYIQSMKIHASTAYGFFRVSIKQIKRHPITNDPVVRNGFIVTDEINKKMDDSLILERVVDDGKKTNFYLRTIITV